VFLARLRVLLLPILLPVALWGAIPGPPDSWVPARWPGGPLELARRHNQSLPPAVEEALTRWYDPSTLHLLADTPVNCLLVTWSIGAPADLERAQRARLLAFTEAAHARGIAVLGLVYPGADPAQFVPPAAEAALDGLVLEGEFPASFLPRVEKALHSRLPAAVVFPLTSQVTPLRSAPWPVLATPGSWPRSRQLTEMGIRAAPSSEPWLDSNLWLIRSFRFAAGRRPVWLGHQPPGGPAPADYLRAAAEAAIAGGRWILSLDDSLQAGLYQKQPAALDTWRRLASCLAFYRDHDAWRGFTPFGPLAIVLDRASPNREVSDEYLNLAARRQVPYRLIDRPGLTAASLAGFAAVLAMDLAPPTAAERAILQSFAEQGGLLVAPHSWGGEVPQGDPFLERPAGKGSIVVYADDLPDTEAVSKDLLDLLGDRAGLRVFNMPSVLTSAASGPAGELLVHLLNYSSYPAASMTIRVYRPYRAARLYTPDAGIATLAIEKSGAAFEISIPRLALAGALVLEP
jgi:hypothetical protein